MDRREKSTQQSVANPLLTSRYQRLQRVIMFAGELVKSLSVEFAGAGPAAQERALAGSDPLAQELSAFQRQVETVSGLVKGGQEVLAEVTRMREFFAIQKLALYEPELAELIKLASALEPQAQLLRRKQADRAPTPPPAVTGRARLTGPLDGLSDQIDKLVGAGENSLGKSVTGLLRRLSQPPNVVSHKTQADPPPGPPPLPPAMANAKLALERGLKFSTAVLHYVAPRLSVIEVSLTLTGLPGKARSPVQIQDEAPAAIMRAGLPPANQARVAPLVSVLLADMAVTRLAHSTIAQWHEAQRVRGEAEMADVAWKQASHARLTSLMQAFNPGKLEGAVYPLSHLHVTFRGLPVLSELFPPPPMPAGLKTSGVKAPGKSLGSA